MLDGPANAPESDLQPREVPDLEGRSLDDAQAVLRERGLEAEVAGREYSAAPTGSSERSERRRIR